MENSIIGTAGHVDHGKTLLIQALTGIDTDRLQEEKRRGITIELGFAYLDFPNGQRVGIIDVPGHEKFIRNMLAGAGGVDFALLVVAADEGFMPQTVEHLDILCLLGLQDGLVVITKMDMVDAEMLAMVQADVEAHVRGTFLEGKPILPVSALTGAGIPQLRTLLQERLQQAPVKNLRNPFRLPVDRVFSVDGFGTVVTGTLVEGQIAENDEAQLYPSGLVAKVRNLQVHGQTVPQARAGQRVAVNLAGLKKSDIRRGDTLAYAGSLENSWMLDVRLQALADSSRQILNHSQVHLYHGARVLLAKVVLLDRDQLAPGESAYAQLRLQEPLAARTGDRFVIRFYSPLETIGGGIVLDPNPPRHKRHDAAVLAALQVREAGSLPAVATHRRKRYGRHCPGRTCRPVCPEPDGTGAGTAKSAGKWAGCGMGGPPVGPFGGGSALAAFGEFASFLSSAKPAAKGYAPRRTAPKVPGGGLACPFLARGALAGKQRPDCPGRFSASL